MLPTTITKGANLMNPRNGLEMISTLKRQRAERVTSLRELRALPSVTNAGIWRLIGGPGRFQRLSKRALRQEAIECARFARSSWHNPLDTEYYSACGYDDYQSESRDQALEYGAELIRAANCLA